MSNSVFIATSIDGYIAASDGNLDWLDTVPFPQGEDGGYAKFMKGIDAIVMGRVTFETVIGFGMGWHYPVPGLILSSTQDTAPAEFSDHVRFLKGSPKEIVDIAGKTGFKSLYIDGGETIQRFLEADLIDQLIITEIPLLLGGGTRLFAELDQSIEFKLSKTELIADRVVQKHYHRKRS